MRQNARRKTLGDVAADFELFVRVFDQEREEESRAAERRQKIRVLGLRRGKAIGAGEGGGGGSDDGSASWWKYVPRPCTRKACPHPWYSPYASHLYTFYTCSSSTPTPKRRLASLLPLRTLCPACAQQNLSVTESSLLQKRELLDDEEWILHAEQVRRDREMEVKFWEGAQERVVLEKGVRGATVEELEREERRGKEEGGEVLVKGRKGEVVRELCVVM